MSDDAPVKPPPVDAATLKAKGDEARRAGKHADARRLYKLAMVAAADAGDKRLVAGCLTGLGHSLADQRELRLAIQAYGDALEMLDEKEYPRERAVLHFNLGSVCLDYHGEDRWTWVMMAGDVLKRALKYFNEKDHPGEFKAASQLLLRAEDEISRNPLAQAEVVLDD